MPRPVSYFFNLPRAFLIKVFLIKNTACIRVLLPPMYIRLRPKKLKNPRQSPCSA